MIEFVNFYLFPALAIGSIYALGAVGISMIFGILRFAHFAHGDFMTLGAYIGLTFIAVMGLSPWFALPAAAPVAISCAKSTASSVTSVKDIRHRARHAPSRPTR